MPSLIEKLRDWYDKQRFEPGWLGWLVNPFYFARRGLDQSLDRLLPELSGDVLDVGCGQKPYGARLIAADRYIGVDIDTPITRQLARADIFYDGRRLPVLDASFDAVLCSQVFEHVFSPDEFLVELNRVLKPGGKLVVTTPFVWDEHEQPHDFARYSSFGLSAALARAGFRILRQEKTCADGRVLVQMITGYLYKVTRTNRREINLLVQLILIAPMSLVGGMVSFLLPGNDDLYLDNVVLAEKPPMSP
jgi:SAM-dependent methyltransferase